MSIKRYHIYAYKHYWPPHLDPDSKHYDPDTYDIPVPYSKDEKRFIIEANTQREAIKLAEKEYGSGERTDPKTHQYKNNPDGSWTIMNVDKVEMLR